MEEALFSTGILASFIAGIVALLAPCCASVMLPAFFASSFRRRSRIVSMTLVFAAGVGTVILPIALGAAAVSRLLVEYHTPVFSIGGALMVVMGTAMLAGRKFMLPMPLAGSSGGRSVRSVYVLGVFSGAASACCAPVLAGVAAVSGAVSSFPAALAVGVAYVFGMVAPLAVLALMWDRRNWGASRLLSDRLVSVWPGGGIRVPLSALLSGALMIVMGVLTVVFAVRGAGMAPDGWEVRLSGYIGHTAATVQNFLGFLPGWASAVLIFAALALLIVTAARRRETHPGASTTAPVPGTLDGKPAGNGQDPQCLSCTPSPDDQDGPPSEGNPKTKERHQ